MKGKIKDLSWLSDEEKALLSCSWYNWNWRAAYKVAKKFRSHVRDVTDDGWRN